MVEAKLKEVLNKMLMNLSRLYQFEPYEIKLGELSKRYKKLLLIMMEVEMIIEELEDLQQSKEEDII